MNDETPKPPKDGYPKNLPNPQPLKKSDREYPAPPPPKEGEPLNKSGGRMPNEPPSKTIGLVAFFVVLFVFFALGFLVAKVYGGACNG